MGRFLRRIELIGISAHDYTALECDESNKTAKERIQERLAVDLSYRIFKVFWASISWRRHEQRTDHRKCYLVKRLEMGRAILKGSANS